MRENDLRDLKAKSERVIARELAQRHRLIRWANRPISEGGLGLDKAEIARRTGYTHQAVGLICRAGQDGNDPTTAREGELVAV